MVLPLQEWKHNGKWKEYEEVQKKKQFYESKIQAVKNVKLESTIAMTVNNLPSQRHIRYL